MVKNIFDKLITRIEYILEEIKFIFENTNSQYNYDSVSKVEVSNFSHFKVFC